MNVRLVDDGDDGGFSICLTAGDDHDVHSLCCGFDVKQPTSRFCTRQTQNVQSMCVLLNWTLKAQHTHTHARAHSKPIFYLFLLFSSQFYLFFIFERWTRSRCWLPMLAGWLTDWLAAACSIFTALRLGACTATHSTARCEFGGKNLWFASDFSKNTKFTVRNARCLANLSIKINLKTLCTFCTNYWHEWPAFSGRKFSFSPRDKSIFFCHGRTNVCNSL